MKSVKQKINDVDRQRLDNYKELQHNIGITQDKIQEAKNEQRESMRNLSREFDTKIKTCLDNAKNYAVEKVTEVRDEIYQTFNSVKDFIQNEINIAKAENGKLLSNLKENLESKFQNEVLESENKLREMIIEEQKTRQEKDKEISNLLESVKKMLLETIKTKIESTQALARALVNEEAAERQKAFEYLLRTFKQKIEALEEFLKKLIYSQIEEVRLEMKELFRKLEIKFEEHKVWTINQLNTIIADVEEYIVSATAREYREDLYKMVESKDNARKFKEVEIEFINMENRRKKELEKIDDEFKRIQDQRDDDLKEIETKFEKVEEQRKEDLKKIDDKFEEMGNKMEEMKMQLETKFDEIDEKIISEAEERMKKDSELEEQMNKMNAKMVK
mmetsp:Transcript_29720/g.27202  ORF Transcript_29720/g.27202 Transcript_29720/m.27202 type:complete len:389 (-) Transcript_29720:1614-2780(-)